MARKKRIGLICYCQLKPDAAKHKLTLRKELHCCNGFSCLQTSVADRLRRLPITIVISDVMPCSQQCILHQHCYRHWPNPAGNRCNVRSLLHDTCQYQQHIQYNSGINTEWRMRCQEGRLQGRVCTEWYPLKVSPTSHWIWMNPKTVLEKSGRHLPLFQLWLSYCTLTK